MKKWKDYYEVLGLSPDADVREIKKAYKDYAFLYHPDRTAGLADSACQKAKVKMQEVNEAYEVLNNPEKRKRYDSEWRQKSTEATGTVMPPQPRVDPPLLSFTGATPGTVLAGSFIVYNDGGSFTNFYVDPPSPPLPWLKITGAQSIGPEQFPIQVEIKVVGQDWGKTYSTSLKVRMDGQETEVRIRLQTKSEPVRPNTAPPTSSGYQSGTTRTKTSSHSTPPPQSTPRAPNYQAAPNNQGSFWSQELGGYIILIGFLLVILGIVKLVSFVGELREGEKSVEVVKTQPAVVRVQPVVTQNSQVRPVVVQTPKIRRDSIISGTFVDTLRVMSNLNTNISNLDGNLPQGYTSDSDPSNTNKELSSLASKKMKKNSSSSSLRSFDPPNFSAAKPGYKVILDNPYKLPINFVIYSINGGEKITVLLGTNERTNIYLVPGEYRVSFLREGIRYRSDKLLTIDGTSHVFRGEDCFGFAYMTSYRVAGDTITRFR